MLNLRDLTPLQEKFIGAYMSGDYRTLAAVAPQRQGKTAGQAMIMSHHAIKQYRNREGNNQHLVVGRSIDSVKRNLEDYMRDSCNQLGYSFRPGKDSWLIANGKIKFHLFGSATKISNRAMQGSTVSSAHFDEATFVNKETFTVSKNRASLKGSIITLACNTNSPHHWLLKSLLQSGDPTLKVIQGDIFDNHHLDEARREEMLKFDKDSYLYKRNILNQWVPDSGLVYPIEDDSMVVDYDMGRKPYGDVSITISPTGNVAALLFVPYKGGYLVYDEYYWTCLEFNYPDMKPIISNDKHIRNLFNKWSFNKAVINDDAGSFSDSLYKFGVLALLGEKDIEIDNGISTVNNFLRNDKLKINKKCEYLLMESASYLWQEETGKPIRENDFLCDALRRGTREYLWQII